MDWRVNLLCFPCIFDNTSHLSLYFNMKQSGLKYENTLKYPYLKAFGCIIAWFGVFVVYFQMMVGYICRGENDLNRDNYE